MYERMLDRERTPSADELTAYCGGAGARFARLNDWLEEACGTRRQIVFPYGKRYGWGVAHRVGKKLVCNVFAEREAFTVMVRLSDGQFASVRERVRPESRALIDGRYPCGDGGWIHYRVTEDRDLEDIRTILAAKRA